MGTPKDAVDSSSICSAVCPIVSSFEATTWTVVLALGFVLVLYLPWCRGDRDKRDVILTRIATTGLLAFFSVLGVLLRVGWRCVACTNGFERLLYSVRGWLFSSLLTASAYLGDLAMIVVDRVPIIERLEPDRYVRIRNYVAGPILEEIVFRGVCCTICMCAFPESNLHAYSTPAMLFSISHAHHAIRLIRTTNYARRDILATTLANVLVTGIFGLYAGMIFTKLGGIVSAITVHVICNCMSLPDVEAILRHRYKIPFFLLFLTGMGIFAVAVMFVLV
uniref:intramembrane prenyl-peptidase Rce1 n=1 Tax=Rhodosorus marinus TaxID=101924 RepID=A0A7S2ZQZ1_9RHOD|mmetsp:Transcript_29224/g.113400  ORF Transcript_29224/g.113400 Transcript_29224/m.113400 type:complete len:278 (+) Transcript_29224:250-1083(+)